MYPQSFRVGGGMRPVIWKMVTLKKNAKFQSTYMGNSRFAQVNEVIFFFYHLEWLRSIHRLLRKYKRIPTLKIKWRGGVSGPSKRS